MVYASSEHPAPRRGFGPCPVQCSHLTSTWTNWYAERIGDFRYGFVAAAVEANLPSGLI